jgi:hypothetical protein
MSKTFTDDNFMTWEAYPSGGDFGFPENPYIIFNCLSNRMLRPRFVEQTGDSADAERIVAQASPHELSSMLARAKEIP